MLRVVQQPSLPKHVRHRYNWWSPQTTLYADRRLVNPIVVFYVLRSTITRLKRRYQCEETTRGLSRSCRPLVTNRAKYRTLWLRHLRYNVATASSTASEMLCLCRISTQTSSTTESLVSGTQGMVTTAMEVCCMAWCILRFVLAIKSTISAESTSAISLS